MIVHFNNTAATIWYKWSGTKEGFEQYLATPEGMSDMMEKRQKSPVAVFIEKDNVYVSVWPDQEGLEIKGAKAKGQNGNKG